MDEIITVIENEIRKRLYQTLRIKMVFDEDAYNNMSVYIDKYFECYNYSRDTENLEDSVMNFIISMRENGYL